ncbi:hypothetical protein KM043_018595 [Ampulex compressa]|nr:hypothetical protein KM043_018595 [Ampulex compressa]
MKAILIPCICIVLLYAVSSAKDLQLDYRLKLHLWYMQDLRNDIQEKINNLYSQSTSTELSTKFSQIVAQYTVFGGLDSKISRALKETLEQVDSVTEKTKKVQHCYDEEYKAFEDLINGVLSAYYQCVNVGFAQLQAPVPHLEECAEQGKKIIQKLKNLMSICWPVHSPAPKESCIIENKVEEIRAAASKCVQGVQ